MALKQCILPFLLLLACSMAAYAQQADSLRHQADSLWYDLEEAVVVHFAGSTEERRVTGSVSVVKEEVIGTKPTSGIDAILAGQAAGVSVKATTGQPGTRSNIRIRGISNLSGNSSPLWVVDGVPLPEAPALTSAEMAAGGMDNLFLTGVGNINPDDIQSISILKDAAAAAIYGSRAANGVIVISTKKGSGDFKVNYNNNLTWTLRPSRNPGLMNSTEKLAWEQELWDEFGAPRYAAAQTDPTAVYPVVGIVGQIRSGAGQYAGLTTAQQDAAIAELASQTTDWYDTILRNGFSHNHHLSFSSGRDELRYYVSMGVTDENGLLVNNDYQRYNLSGRLQIKPAKRLYLSFGAEASSQRSVMPESTVDPFTYAYFANPYERPDAPDNTWFTLGYYNGRAGEMVMPDSGFNILREMSLNSTTSTNNSASGRFEAIYYPGGGLKISFLVSGSKGDKDSDRIIDKDSYTGFRDRLGNDDRSQTKLYGSITQSRTGTWSYLARGLADWQYYWPGLKMYSEIIGGTEIRADGYSTVFSKRYGYDPSTKTAIMPTPSGPTDQWLEQINRLDGEYYGENRYVSFFLSGDACINNSLVLNATVRTDGSSAFGLNRQFHPTWSTGLAWHAIPYSEAPLSHLTIRSSYGYTGNINSSAQHLLVMEYDLNKYREAAGRQYALGSIAGAPNPNLGWERTADLKAGADMGFFSDALTLNAEWYRRTSSDVVCPTPVVSTTGYTSINFNSADILNTGIELTLNYKKSFRDWSISAGGNFAYNYNKVIRFTPAYGSTVTAKDRYVEGYPVGAVFAGEGGRVDLASGLYGFYFRSDAKVSSAKDLNNPDNYRKYLGTTVAPYTGGLNLAVSYKSLRLSLNGVYSFGAVAFDKIVSPASYLNARHDGIATEEVQSQYSDLYANHLNVTRDRTDRWTADNTSALYPRIYDRFDASYNFAYTHPMESSIVDGIYLKDIAYLKIKNIILGWKAPASRYWKGLEVHASLGNFITLTPYDGVDPEVPGATYPTPRSVSLGINVTL